jgi:uncharacterized protein
MKVDIMAQFKWRKWNNILHRDIGYLAVAMTLVYGISGLAVNHVADWNPNYKIEKETRTIAPINGTNKEAAVKEAITQLQLSEEPVNTFRPDPETLQLFYDKKTYSIDLPTGNVLVEQTHPRRVLYEMNQLHVNAPKGIWTLIADLFAVSLILMAITGMFMLKGPTGITGRGKWFVAIGVLIPALYWVYWMNFQ